jgi:hypothetical protein
MMPCGYGSPYIDESRLLEIELSKGGHVTVGCLL